MITQIPAFKAQQEKFEENKIAFSHLTYKKVSLRATNNNELFFF
jgi:hypothetical protein